MGHCVQLAAEVTGTSEEVYSRDNGGYSRERTDTEATELGEDGRATQLLDPHQSGAPKTWPLLGSGTASLPDKECHTYSDLEKQQELIILNSYFGVYCVC